MDFIGFDVEECTGKLDCTGIDMLVGEFPIVNADDGIVYVDG
jgi:hypothetical protein